VGEGRVYIGGRGLADRAVSGLRGPTDRAGYEPRAEAAAHGLPGHRAGSPVARKVRTGPAQVPGYFDGPWTGPRITGHLANYNLVLDDLLHRTGGSVFRSRSDP
jgi:hypothetical protein